MKKIITTMLPFALLATALTSCGGGTTEYNVTFPDINGLVPPTNLKVKKGQDYTATVGVNQDLVPGVTLPEAPTKVTSGNGVLTKGDGYTWDLKESNTKAEFKIPAKNITGDIAVELSLVQGDIKVTSIEFTLEKSEAEVGEQVKIKNITVLPENATNKTINWSLSDPDAGEIHTMGEDPYVIGKVVTTEPIKVIATAADGSGVTKDASISFTEHEHDYGDLHPAVAPTREEDGNIAYYQCTECGKYFDEEFNEISEEDIVVKKSVLSDTFTQNDPDYPNNDKNWALPDLPLDELLVIDIKFTEGTKVEMMLGDGWDNYIGYFNVEVDNNGSYHLQDNSSFLGVGYAMTEDGYFRMYIDHSKLSKGQTPDQMEKYNLLYIRNIAASGEIHVNPHSAVGGTITRGYKLKADDWKYLISESYEHSLEDTVTVDVKFISTDKNFSFRFQENWGTTSKYIKLAPSGELVDSGDFKGIQVVKLDDVEGFATGYYRLMINLKQLNNNKETFASTDFTKVNRIVLTNNDCEAYVDVDTVHEGLTYNNWLEFTGQQDADTPMKFSFHNLTDIRDSEGQFIEGKALYFEVKAESAVDNAKVIFSLMDIKMISDTQPKEKWCNMGKMVFTYNANSEITDLVIQGTGNKWPIKQKLEDGVWAITIPFDKLSGDGINDATTFNSVYGADSGQGVVKAGVSKFAINLDSIGLVDYEPTL